MKDKSFNYIDQRISPKTDTPKAITARLEKYRADPKRDAERKGISDERMEELRVSFFAQELKTPQPISVKRLEKAWGQLGGGESIKKMLTLCYLFRSNLCK